MMTIERDLILLVPWTDNQRDLWLGLDLISGREVREFTCGPDLHLGRPDAIVVPVGSADCRLLSDGNLMVGEGVLWSLLDPLGAGRSIEPAGGDRQLMETELRRARQRFLTRLTWWCELGDDLDARIRSLLRGYQPDLSPLLDLLTAAATLPEVGGSSAGEAGPPDPHSPLSLPRDGVITACPDEPDGLAVWLQDPDGFGALYGPEFTPRGEQADMAREVAVNLRDRRALLVEAGTGVGKTLAYLVPLIKTLAETEGRAVVSTHTRALQTQILQQDLPRIEPLLEGRRFALLKGRRNYLCRRQREAFLARGSDDVLAALQMAAFLLWLEATDEGLRDELADHPLLRSEVRRLFDAADLCLPQLCYSGDRCFVQRARRRAREADLLVVNHALLLADLHADHTLLGETDHLVVDEAHRLPHVTLEAHAVVCSPRRLDDITDLVGQNKGTSALPERVALLARRLADQGVDGAKAAGAAETFGRALAAALGVFRRWWHDLGGRVDEALTSSDRTGVELRVRDKDEAFGTLRPVTAELLEALADASQAFATLAGRTSVLDDLSSGLEDDLAQIAQSNLLLRQLQHDIRFLTSDPDDDWVTWLLPGARQGLRRLGATPLEAGPILRHYWQTSELAPVMTSATLAIGEDFTHMLEELGLTRRQPATATYISASPFDYHRQTLALAPSHFPAPNAPDFGTAVGDVLRELAERVPRKTMGLFTSYRLLDQAAEVLAAAGMPSDEPMGEEGFAFSAREPAGDTSKPRVLVQSPRGASSALLSRFRRSRRAVLLGTNTFWEGVDFPGDDLEILVVSKLPFLVPSDPWVEARCEKVAAAGENAFTSFMVRDAVLRLRQGIGRLIRRTSDRGVFIILDNRLHTKNYGVTFLNALPALPVAFQGIGDLLERVEGFFHSTEGRAP